MKQHELVYFTEIWARGGIMGSEVQTTWWGNCCVMLCCTLINNTVISNLFIYLFIFNLPLDVCRLSSPLWFCCCFYNRLIMLLLVWFLFFFFFFAAILCVPCSFNKTILHCFFFCRGWKKSWYFQQNWKDFCSHPWLLLTQSLQSEMTNLVTGEEHLWLHTD